jgi:hypothetical protein
MDRKNKRAAHQQQQGLNGQSQHMNQQRPLQDQGQHPSRVSLHQASSSRTFAMPNGMMIEDPSRSFMPNFVTNQHNREGDLLFGVPDDLQATSSASAGTMLPNQQAMTGSFRSDWSSAQLTRDSGEDLETHSRYEKSFESINRNPISTQAFGTSPFSHPGSQSVFYSADLTANRDGEKSQTAGQSPIKARDIWRGSEVASQGGDYGTGGIEINEEDFLPSSLSDLLTPAELQRRTRTGMIAAQSSSSILTPQSLPSRTTKSNVPWDALYQQRRLHHPQSALSRELDETTAAKLESQRAAAANSVLTPPTYLHPGQSQLGVSNTSAGFLTSRLRKGLATGHLDDEVEETKSRPLNAYSPGAHAALSHAPGQSLPQGLASGLSSLHLRSDDNKSIDPIAGGLQGEARYRYVTNHFNQHHNGAMSGAYGRGYDELEPAAPSSIFAQRAPLHFNMARSMGVGSNNASASTSFEAPQQQISNHAIPLSTSINGNSQVFSPYAQSPANRAEGGIAIPPPSSSGINSVEASTLPGSSSNTNHTYNNNKSFNSHPSKHRVRNAANVAGSPLTLPTTGEVVEEEPIFELE